MVKRKVLLRAGEVETSEKGGDHEYRFKLKKGVSGEGALSKTELFKNGLGGLGETELSVI